MPNNANVTSLEQLAHFLECSKHFRAQLIKELENVQVELRGISHWIERDARDYWTAELRTAQRQFVECQQALLRCMSYVREDERRPCTEEKKRVHRAEARKAICEEKLKAVQAAAAAWEREQNKNSAKIERCRDLADSNMAVAIGHLANQIERLEAYASLKSTPWKTTTLTTSEQEPPESASITPALHDKKTPNVLPSDQNESKK